MRGFVKRKKEIKLKFSKQSLIIYRTSNTQSFVLQKVKCHLSFAQLRFVSKVGGRVVKRSPSDKEHQNFRLRWLAYAAQLTVYQANSCKKDDTNTLQKKKIK